MRSRNPGYLASRESSTSDTVAPSTSTTDSPEVRRRSGPGTLTLTAIKGLPSISIGKSRYSTGGFSTDPGSTGVRESLFERPDRWLDGALVAIQVGDHLHGFEAVAGDVGHHRLVALPAPRPGQLP